MFDKLFNRLSVSVLSFRILQLSIVGIAVVLVFISFLVGTFHMEKQRGNEQFVVLSELTTIGNRLEGTLRSTFNLTQGLVHLIRIQNNISESQFNAFCKMAMDESKYIRNVALAPQNRVTQVYPLAGNEKVLGLFYFTHKEQRSAVVKAMKMRRPVLAGPVELVQGGIALINRSPVFIQHEADSSTYWGIVSIVANYDSILHDVGISKNESLRIALQGSDGLGVAGPVFLGDSSIVAQNPVVVDVCVPGGSWRLMAIPAGGWSRQSLFNSFYFIFSLAISVLIVVVFSVLIVVNRSMRAKNSLLANEIRERKKVEQELSRAKEQAEEANRVKSAFLANMSHEIRTPMNAIQGFTDVILSGDSSSELTMEYAEIINSSSKQLLGVINDIVDISMIDVGQLKITKATVRLNKLLQDTINLHSQAALARGLQLSMQPSFPDNNDSIVADEQRLFQVVNNLISNAIKFTDSGSVELGYGIESGDRIRIYVKDTGIGIPEKFHGVIFERFRQVDDDLSRKYGGTGLGLSICKSIVELMGGEMGVDSVPGVGSTFFFTLPYLRALESSTVMYKPPRTVDLTAKTVLIAEDDNLNYLLLQKLVAKTGAEVLRANNGREAVDIFNSRAVDLVLMDLKMPIMNGYEAISAIRKISGNVPIIAQTAYAMSGEKQLAVAAGCNYYITKPINHSELFDIVGKLFEQNV